MYAFISYFANPQNEDGSGNREGEKENRLRLGLVLVTTNREAFFDMKAWKDSVAEVC